MFLTDIETCEFNRYLEVFDFRDEIRDKTLLVTGSKGIIGSGVIKWLLLENKLHNTNVHIIASTRNVNSRPGYVEDSDLIEYCEFGSEMSFCEDRTIDYIVHSAAPTSNKVFQSMPVESLSVIVDGTKNMLELAKQHKKSKMIYLSSEEAYGTPVIETPISEKYVGGGR